jgi:hypothetical protein
MSLKRSCASVGDTPGARGDSEVDASAPGAPAGAPEAIRPSSWAGIAEVGIIFGLAAWAWMLTGRFVQGDLMVTYGINPAVVPRAIILTIVGLATLLLVAELAQPRIRSRLRFHPRTGAVLFALAILSVYAFSFEALGAFTLMPVFCVALSLAFMRRPLWILFAYGIGVSILTWVVFVLLLRAPLPGLRLPFF